MDTQTIDEEFDKLQTEFQDVAKTVQGLAAKLQTAEKAGDSNATEWLADLKQVAQDIDDEQEQVKVLLLAVHGFIGELTAAHAQETAAAPAGEKPSLFAPGKDPFPDEDQAQPVRQRQPQQGSPSVRSTARMSLQGLAGTTVRRVGSNHRPPGYAGSTAAVLAGDEAGAAVW
jgi:hypothetical protein